MKTLIKEIEDLIEKREDEIDARIDEEKYSAPQSYIDDLKGYRRGVSATGRVILELIKRKNI